MIILQQTRGFLSSNDGLALDVQPSIDRSYSIDPNSTSGFLINSRLGPSLAYTRSSSATEVDSNGLVSFANENQVNFSGSIVNGFGWGLTGATSVIDGAGPVGANAYLISETTSNTFHNVGSNGSTTTVNGFNSVAGLIYTYSIFLKKVLGSIDWVQLTLGSGGFGSIQFVNFNLSNGTIGNSGGGAVGAIEAYPDNWYRVSITAPTTITSLSFACSVGFTNNIDSTSRLPVYAGNPANQVLAAAGQFQRGSVVGTYIPTTSSLRYAPRFDRDPITGESRGFLIEGSTTNLSRRSQTIAATVGWALSGNIISTISSTIGPDGSPSYLISEGSQTQTQLLQNTGGNGGVNATSVTAGTTYVGSIFLKKAPVGPDWVQLTLGGVGFGSSQFANFNLSTGSVGNFSGLPSGYTPVIQQFPNGWYRCCIAATATATSSSSANVVVAFVNNTNINTRLLTYGGNPANGYLATMCQFEVGQYASSYNQTQTVSTARSGDVCSISGSDFNQIWTGSGGSIEIDFIPYAPVSNNTQQAIYDFTDNTGLNRFRVLRSASTGVLRTLNTVSGISDVDITTLTATQPYTNNRLALAFAANNFSVCYNSNIIGSDTSGLLVPANRLIIGSASAGGPTSPLNGTILGLKVYRRPLPNPKLEAITV